MEQIAVTERLAQWLCSTRYEDLPAQVREKTVDVIYDSVGCMLACSTLDEVQTIVGFIVDEGCRADCTIIGNRAMTSAVSAAMAHGAMAHGDEVDPVHLASVGGHVAAGPVPAALAVGEWLNSSGKDVARAVALGYELGGRMMTVFYREHDYISRRFYPTAVIGCLSSAVAAGLLLGFDPRQLQIAMGLATYQAAGPDNMMHDTSHMGKTFQVAAACRNGVTAALLTHRGAHVPLDILDGSLGLFDTYLGKPELGAKLLLPELGSYYAITDVMHKRYSTGTPNQTYVQGLLSLLEKNPLTAEEIAAVEIQMHKPGLHTTPTTRPASIATNVVSAVAVVERKLDFYRLHDFAHVVTPAVAAMQKKIRVVPRGDWQGLEHNRHAIVTITTTAGKKLEEEVWYRPMTRPELDQKFDELVTPQAGAQKTRELRALLQGIESAAGIRPLMEKLRG